MDTGIKLSAGYKMIGWYLCPVHPYEAPNKLTFFTINYRYSYRAYVLYHFYV
jgi:hypothetical protein